MPADLRIESILELIQSFAAGNLGARVEPSDSGDHLDAVIVGLNMLGEELNESTVSLAKYAIKVRQLTAALEQVKTLSGLLPICAWCKRVRDDAGYWTQIESYLARYSDATLTHGICPTCEGQEWDSDEGLADRRRNRG